MGQIPSLISDTRLGAMELGGGKSVVDINPLCEIPSQNARNPMSPAAESAYLCEVFTGQCPPCFISRYLAASL